MGQLELYRETSTNPPAKNQTIPTLQLVTTLEEHPDRIVALIFCGGAQDHCDQTTIVSHGGKNQMETVSDETSGLEPFGTLDLRQQAVGVGVALSIPDEEALLADCSDLRMAGVDVSRQQ